MQGMMIQDMSTRTSSSSTVVARGEKSTAEKSFGAFLGEGQVDAGQAPKETDAEVEVHLAKSGKKAEKKLSPEAVPFFMAALFDHSAAFVSPSDNIDQVAGAEQAQKMIDAWLNTDGDEGANPVELLTKTLDALGLTLATGQDQPGSIAHVSSATLNETEIAELKELMRMMLAQGPLSTSPEGRSLPTELQQLLAQFQAVAEENQDGEINFPSGQIPAVEGSVPAGDFRRDFVNMQVEKGDVTTGAVAKEAVTKEVATKEAIPKEVATRGERDIQVAKFADNLAPQNRSTVEVEEIAAERVRHQGVARPTAGLQESQMARLLNPREEQSTLHQQQFDKNAGKIEAAQLAVADSAMVAVKLETEVKTGGEQLPEAVKNVTSLSSTNTPLQAQGPPPVTSALSQNSAMTASAAKMMQLPSGLQLAENQVVGQVVSHLAGSSDGESGRIRLRLHPAELGSVRLDLIVEGDRVRAHLQAQTQQVQEVLSRHLPQLREALQQQGLTVDEFRVDVQSGQDQSAPRDFAWQQSQQRESSARTPLPDNDWPQPEVIIPLQQVMQTAGGSISLRV